MNNRRKVIHLAVLGIYILYALFPLLYATGGASGDGAAYAFLSPAADQRSTAGQKQLLVPSGEQDTGSPSAPVSHVLLKKKRALAPSFKEIVPKLVAQYINFNDHEPSSKIASVSLPIPFDTLNCPSGFPYYHSGISPPSV